MENKFEKAPRIKAPFAKISLSIILVCLCFTLTACDPSAYYFKHEDLADVVSVDLIDYDNPEQKHFITWLFPGSDMLPYDDSKESVVESLKKNMIPDFIDDLCECYILDKYYTYDSPRGLCIKLTCRNGDFYIVSSNYLKNSFAGYIGKFNSDGEVVEFIGCFESVLYYKTLVNDYFQMQI